MFSLSIFHETVSYVQDTWADVHEMATTQAASTSHKERTEKVASDGARGARSRGIQFNHDLCLIIGRLQ